MVEETVRVPRNAWSECWPIALLLLLGSVLFLLRLGALPYHGEESRRVQIAREMVVSGDYLVPRLQGHPWPTKPPLFYWTLAGTIWLSQSLDPWILRLPSATATIFLACLLAWYVRPALSGLGAFATGFVFLSFGDILDSGSDAEIDATFSLFVTASLLLWHGGMQRGWSPTLCWTLGYGFTGLALLTKGLQGPVYFVLAAYGWVLLTRRWRWLFHPGQLVGLGLFLGLVLAWMVPFALQEGTHSLQAVFVSESVSRTLGGWDPFLGHLFNFPLKWAGSLLPWSPLLLGYLSPWVQRQVRTHHPQACFTALAFGLAFPTCWLPPGGEERYLRPVLPCVAVLVGVLLHLLAQPSLPQLFLHWVWRGFLICWSVAVFGGSIALLLVSLGIGPPRVSDWQEPLWVAGPFALLATTIAFFLLHTARTSHAPRAIPAFLAIGLLAWVCVHGLLVNRGLRRQMDSAEQVARLRARIGRSAQLVSYGPVNHLFLLLNDRAIERREWPKDARDSMTPMEDYFCFDSFRGAHPPLPFAWEEVARLSMDRTHRSIADNVVIVGRRVEPQEAVARKGDASLHGFFP